MNLLTIQGISKQYTVNTPPAVDDVSFDCKPGEIVSIIGRSGSGKTTILRMIAGLEIPDKGQIKLYEKKLNSASVFVSPEKRNCGLVFQDYALFPNKTVYQNITFGKGAIDDPEHLEHLVEMADIGSLADRFPHEISGGEQQRVALVRALATCPKLLLLDEPLSHLDPELKESVRSKLLTLLHSTKTTTLYVSHDIEETMTMSDRMVVMRRGRLEQVGTPDEIYKRPSTAYVAQLFGKTNLIPRHFIPGHAHAFTDDMCGHEVVPTRPHQWMIIEKPSADSPSFRGRVQSVLNCGAYQEVALETKDFTLTLHVTHKTPVRAGETHTVQWIFPE
jgi:iron(III) transport system ATP-binding protein